MRRSPEQQEMDFAAQLEIGGTYRAWGPSPEWEKRQGPALVVVITGTDEKGYTTKPATGSKKGPSSHIAFKAAYMWIKVEE